ncbi:MAG: phosphomannomutase CpsG [Candidatus Hinthialibacter antarcticus]|nr:phosphomannomutase CpsG [Candidatus Hinthialibacter antarcticus]
MTDYTPLPCFKAYDARGRVPEELNPDLAYNIGRATVQFLSAKKIVVGRDIRSSGNELSQALIRGLTEGGADVVDIGLCGTEMVYFATSHLNADGGIMITASHNPPEYNGMKFVREGSRPISSETGLKDIERLASIGKFEASSETGSIEQIDVMAPYIERILKTVDISVLKPLRLVVNAGNGCAGPALDQLEKHLPFEFIKVHHNPDETFPNGVPNPLLPENRASTADVVIREKADAGIAWDGDFDRCFFFDENGNFIEGYYIVGFLAEAMLQREKGAKIVYDPRLTWNTIETVKQNGGEAVQCRSGHAFIKEKMREVNAIYGGEMSAHHYFRDFFFCDSGMVPWLLVVEIMCKTGKSISQLVSERIQAFPCSGEINRRIVDADAAIQRVDDKFREQSIHIDMTDGISFEFEQWRFNLRKSNTEPILRLNVETRSDSNLLEEKTNELLALIDIK